MQIISNPTLPLRHCVDSRSSNRSGRFQLQKTKQTVLKHRCYPMLCLFLMKIIIVINHVCVRVRTFVEDGSYQREGGRLCT